MMKTLVIVLLLAAAGSATVAQYARYEEVVRNPKETDLLYGSTLGPRNETWYFTTAATLTSIIIPSQISFCGSGPLVNGMYDEAIDLFVYETKLASSAAAVKTYLVASGSFKGAVSYGQELDIPLWNSTLSRAPRVLSYINPSSGYKYTLNIVFKTTGIYPWYTTRSLSTYSIVHAGTNVPGIAIGLSYALG
ncbi:uncharacterized protein LOC126458342 [Schistocerca serialis cubense]|uniref:uncharacterized protein LOC126458342 n=1 Tax=Schistocerca serialis cubense TaxID=2023355 RepID=UPI00214EF36B|nr:uncharacterized protein LOC126458342 [Schistocerca serialis cubense]